MSVSAIVTRKTEKCRIESAIVKSKVALSTAKSANTTRISAIAATAHITAILGITITLGITATLRIIAIARITGIVIAIGIIAIRATKLRGRLNTVTTTITRIAIATIDGMLGVHRITR